MPNVQKALDTVVCDHYIYFLFSDTKVYLDRYNIKDNSYERQYLNENLKDLMVFENNYFYWRSIMGG